MSRDWLISFIGECEMLDFSAMKCDLFYARGVPFSIKLLCKMRIMRCDAPRKGPGNEVDAPEL